MNLKEPEYIVYFTKKTDLILNDQLSESNKNLVTICQDFGDLVNKISKYKESHTMKIYPVLSTSFDNIDDARNFHQQKIIANFDIEKLNSTVSLIIKSTIDSLKDDIGLSDRQKFCLAIKDIFSSIHNSEIDIEEDKIEFHIRYDHNKFLLDVKSLNLYTLLLQFGIPVKYKDVSDVKEFALPYGSFTIHDGEPTFIPINK
jgi:hypothetical protein